MKPMYCALSICVATATLAAPAEHPFIIWTRDEAAAIRKTIETESWASNAYQRLCADKDKGQQIRDLFNFAVFGDKKARDAEKKYLLSFIGAPVNEREWSCNYMHALRYDTLYHELSPEERAGIEETFRKHVRHQIENGNRNRGKWNWLPNMQWPRTQGMHLMAIALADTNLVETIASSPGGWRYYFDDYISDGQFYNEEFGKYYSVVGEMFLWCRGCDRLGLNHLGYGYTGKNGATMRRYIRSLQSLGYPRVDIGTERPTYPRISMGDARGSGLQQPLVPGYEPDGSGGPLSWRGSNMNGRDNRDQIVSKMRERLWFEISHMQWPEDGWDYFLAACRLPGDDIYIPSLLWGCPPIDPAKVKPPTAPSGIYPERGFAMLRAEEGPAYWESAAPAMALQFTQPYAHGVADSFAILGFTAFNRQVYVNRQVSAGYSGTDPGWSNGARSHSTVLVDGQEPKRCGPAILRHLFKPAVKFAAVRSTGVYPGVDQTRAIILTREYALDVFSLASADQHSYLWLAHGTGLACPDNPQEWAPSKLLTGLLYDVRDVQSFLAESQPWAITMMQPPSTRLRGFGEPPGPRHIEQQIGVKLRMLGAPRTVANHGFGPMRPGDLHRLNDGADIPGEPVVAVYRQATNTAFVALHEPFDRVPQIKTFKRIAQTDDAVLVAITGERGLDDRVAVRWGPDADKPITLGDSLETITFTGFAFVRIGADSIRIHGNASSFRIAAAGASAFLTDDGELKGLSAGGFLQYPTNAASIPFGSAALAAEEPPEAKPVSLRWSPTVAAIPLGSTKPLQAVLQNLAKTPLTCSFRLDSDQHVTAEPNAFDLTGLPPGASTTLTVRLTSSSTNTPAGGRLVPTMESSLGFSLQPTPLPYSCGVTVEHREDLPRRFVKRITAPRYIAEYDYHNSVAAALMLDGDGHRRDGDFPALWRSTTNNQGLLSWSRQKIEGYVAFNPNLTRDQSGRPFLAEMGQHPHGFVSPLVYFFTESWIQVRQRQGSPTEAISFECGQERKNQLSLKLLDALGTAIDKTPNGTAVAACFRTEPNCTAGLLTLYPPDAQWHDGRVTQPGNTAMAFTFCQESEIADILSAWRAYSAPTVRPHQQGEVRN